MLKKIILIIGLCLVFSTVFSVNGAVITGTDLTLASSGSTGNVDLILDQVPDGIAGYQLDLSFSEAGVAEFVSVNFPASFNLNSASTLPSSTVKIVGVDLMSQINPGSQNVILATVGISSLVTSGDVMIEISVGELTDAEGDPIPVTVSGSRVTVGTPTVAPTPTPTATPTASPTVTPTSTPTGDPTPAPTVEPTVTPIPVPTQDLPLLAEFTATPQTGTPPLRVNFTDLSTGTPKQWRWDFGDGTVSQIQNPSHVYGGLGRYSVTLEVMRGNLSSVERKTELIRVVGDYPTGPSGFVMVTSNPSGAEVSISDRYIGTTPAMLTVPAGSYSLTFEADGYQKKYIPVTIRPNDMKLIPKVTLKVIPE